MKVADFRKNLKESFDEALKGHTVLIERGGVTYKLIADVVVQTPSRQIQTAHKTFIEPTYHSDEETDPGAPETDDQPRTGLESLPKNKIEPIYRNKKKRKL